MELTLGTKLFRFVSYLRERSRAQGLAHLPHFLYRRLRVELTERRYGIRTRGWIGSTSITSDPNCFDYEPLDYETIRLALESLDFQSKPQVLLDYGCGKGRVLAVATRFPFTRVIGIELSKYLCEITEANLAGMRLAKLCENTLVVNGDAREYEVPSDVSAIMLFNPFAGDVLEAVIHRIEDSLRKTPRAMTVFHIHFRKVNSAFSVSTQFVRKGEIPLVFREEMVFEVFESVPA